MARDYPADDDPGLGPDESGKPESWLILAAESGAGIYLGFRDGVERDDVQACLDRGGQLDELLNIVPVAPGEVYVLRKDEGGRHTPFFTGYRPQFYVGTLDVTGMVDLPEGVEMVMPGDNITMDVELQKEIAMEKELRFAIREGGRTVGAGVVAKITE